MKRPALRLALAALATAAAAAHCAHGYLPRERPAAPSASARELLGAGEVAAWIPYPHQNLALLERRTGELGAWLGAALGREAERAPRLPRLGPFPVPPARELAVVSRADGGVRAELVVYPAVAVLARAAGTVARNPWLAGGEVQLDGARRGRVTWRGRTWRLEAGNAEPRPATAAGPAATVPPAGEWLGLVRLSAPIAPLPAGLYEVARDSGSGEIRVVAGAPPAALTARLPAGEAGVAPPAGWWAERAPDGASRALVVWDFGGDVPGLPALAALDRGGARPYRLPTEPLARLVGRRLVESAAAGYRIRALEQEAAARAEPLARVFAARLDGAGGDAPPLAALAAARPGALERRARGVARALGAVPLVGAEGARPFARLALALAPFGDCALATLEIGAAGEFVRLIPCSGSVLPGGRSD